MFETEGAGRNSALGEPEALDEAAAAIQANAKQSALGDVRSQGVFRGRVPQVSDWLDAWAESTETTAKGFPEAAVHRH